MRRRAPTTPLTYTMQQFLGQTQASVDATIAFINTAHPDDFPRLLGAALRFTKPDARD